MVNAACYDVRISHHRHYPVDHSVRIRSRLWLVDLDEIPALPRGFGWLCRFDSADHLDRADQLDPCWRPLRDSLTDWLAERAVPRPARILMLANPRVLGYVFNPLSVFYCLDAAGLLTHVVAEVRNTYGGRHRYLLLPDADGAAQVEKAFYVSPFYPVDGYYRLRLPLPHERLLVSVALHRPGERPFTAVVTGNRRPARLWTALRTPLATRAIMFAIKGHGITLYAKGLRPHSRPVEPRPVEPLPAERRPSGIAGRA
jgi:uncharacterized protein